MLPAKRPADQTPERTSLRTFIVEDNALIRENLIAALEELAPVRVVGWADGEDAARRWLDATRDGCELVIVDIFLRDGSGLGVLKATRGHAARRIVLSNYATRDIREACLAQGADRVFDKSNELDELIAYCQRLASGAPNTVPGGLS
jgi:DNA-binding NarL/FixJ family response regulator